MKNLNLNKKVSRRHKKLEKLASMQRVKAATGKWNHCPPAKFFLKDVLRPSQQFFSHVLHFLFLT